jgi:hypothetical protein
MMQPAERELRTELAPLVEEGALQVVPHKGFLSSRAGDYCKGCTFDPKSNCPFTPMYWAYVARHERALANVARLELPLRSLAKRDAQQRARDQRIYERVLTALLAEERLTPQSLEESDAAPSDGAG